MKIEIFRKNQACHFEAKNEEGNTISIDGSPAIGGENLGFRPMQLVAAGAGTCSAMDVITILKKQKQELEDISIEVMALRSDEIPAVFEKIHIQFNLKGKLDEKKVEKALELSVEKYCSVLKMLDKTADVSYDYDIEE